MERNSKNRVNVVLSSIAIMATMALAGCSGGDSATLVTPAPTTPTTPTAPTAPTFVVKDTAGAVITGATVYAIPVADVTALSAQPITLTAGNYTADAQKVDEPLEDLINGNYTPAGGGVGTYKSAVTDATGKAVFSGLATGTTDKYFIYVKPASTDTTHLPGGSICRSPVTGASIDKKETAIKVSTTPTSAATYIGSSACITCHPTYSTAKQTLHKLGIMVPKSPSGLQDVAKFSSTTDPDQDFYAGLKKFEAGTTVYFYTNAATTTVSAFKTLGTNPTPAQLGTGQVYFTLSLSKVGTVYKVTFNNIITPTDPNNGMVKDVALTYGGGEHKQRYLTKLGNSLYVIPVQFNSQGSDTSADSGRTQWAEYNTVSSKWWDATSNVFLMPEVVAKTKSFDINCAGCHFNGYNVTKNSAGEYLATGSPDANGEVNPVTGAKEELNIGCESCHGAGSEHKNAGGAGKFIVTPQNTTPEREVAICAQCHTRSLGAGTDLHTEAPLDSNNKMMKPGTSRAAYLTANVSRHDALASSDLWADAKHSKKHHQQSTDFIQTKKYRNTTRLLTCASCHDVHAPGTDRHQLSGISDGSLCKGCHTANADVAAHTQAKTGSSSSMGTCINCHATKTAKSGSGNPVAGMTGASGTKYYQNDITSHLFDAPNKTKASPTNAMPIPYTHSCGPCHSNSSL